MIIFIFSFSLYKALEISTLDKIHATLKVILLDVVDDVKEHKYDLKQQDFHEEKEYKFEPLYIRLLKINKKDHSSSIIKSNDFPSSIVKPIKNADTLLTHNISFENHREYIISRVKIHMDHNEYVVEVATNYGALNATLENFFYILIFIVPIILIFATIGAYFLIYKSFLPIESILFHLKNIHATDLSKRLQTLDNNDEIDLLTKEINSLLTRLEISFENVSQFSSDASHELKTPLTIIRGEIEIALRKDRSTSEYKQSLETCLDEVLVIQQTIDDLLFLAKSKEHVQYDQHHIYLDEISLEATKDLENYSHLKNVQVDVLIEDAMQIKGHGQLLKIAIKNVLKNAISFSHENAKVTLKNYLKNNEMIISIEDKGIGIALSEQEKIFEKFYRTDKSRNKESGGTGLGMAISQKIVAMHEGKISLNSQENKGTTILFKFPLNTK